MRFKWIRQCNDKRRNSFGNTKGGLEEGDYSF